MSHNLSPPDKEGAVQGDIASVERASSKGSYAPQPPSALHRELKNRHVTMITIGGVIGTGLFLGTASALMNGGPVGLLLGYMFVGTICYSVMVCLGEMICYLPLAGGHIKLAERFVDPAFSFALGWNVWYSSTVTFPAEISAAATIINFWHPGVNNAVWVTMCLVVAVGINMSGVGVYGESEFIFASIKVVTIVGLLILGIILDLGGGPNHQRIGFRYWKDPGPFVQFDGISGARGRFLGWSLVATQAVFSYIGTEAIALAAAEARNPRKNLPKAIRRVYIRILLFYIGGTFVIGLLVPSNNPLLNLNSENASASPFVIAITQAGIKGLPSVINAALLTSAWSASSSSLYIASRGLYGLAVAGNAPKIFLRTSRTGLPYVAVTTCGAFALLSYMAVSNSSGMVFIWFSNMTANAGLMSWFCISIIYLRFRKGFFAQGYRTVDLPYSSPLQPYAAWWAVVSSFAMLFFSGWEVFLKGRWSTATFVTNYLPVMLFPVLYGVAKIATRAPLVKAGDMDFRSGIAAIEAITFDDRPKNALEAFWMWLM